MKNFKPVLFSTTMIQAILEGRKTMTRRVMKPQPVKDENGIWYYGKDGRGTISPTDMVNICPFGIKCPYGSKGDVLWVRETMIKNDGFTYWPVADGYKKNTKYDKTIPSIFMPKSACRIFLEISNVKIERLNDISRTDASSEGVCIKDKQKRFKGYQEHRWPEENFAILWELLKGAHSWAANPFVWVIEFNRVEKPEGFI